MKRGYVPKQHGAWAMLVIPFLFGVLAARPVPLHALLFLVWLTVYLCSYPLLQWIRTRKREYYQKPTFLYASLLIPIAACLVALHPAIIEMSLLFIPLFLVNCHYARQNRERAFTNDVAAIVQFSLMVFVAFEVGGGENWRLATELFTFSVLYFIGTAVFVKTIIREKQNKMYYLFSVCYHLALIIGAAIWFPSGLLVPLAVLLMRAIWFPRMKLSAGNDPMSVYVYLNKIPDDRYAQEV